MLARQGVADRHGFLVAVVGQRWAAARRAGLVRDANYAIASSDPDAPWAKRRLVALYRSPITGMLETGGTATCYDEPYDVVACAKAREAALDALADAYRVSRRRAKADIRRRALRDARDWLQRALGWLDRDDPIARHGAAADVRAALEALEGARS